MSGAAIGAGRGGAADEEGGRGEADGGAAGSGGGEARAVETIRDVAVLGAGTMGHGIAQVTALSGRRVRLFDADPEALEAGLERIRRNLDRGVELGKVETAARAAALARIQPVDRLEVAAGGVDAAIEAVPERIELKRETLAAAASLAAEGALIATNTSSLSVTAIAEAVPAPERVVGMHFFNPVHIMELVEVVRGRASSETAVERARDLARSMGKTPIVVNDAPGFASSRLGVALGLEAIRMLEEEVASAEDIDRAMTLGYRHPMGPLRLTDLVGLDVRLDIARYLHRALDSLRFEPPALLERMVEEGKLGRKTGEGFYRWEDDG